MFWLVALTGLFRLGCLQGLLWEVSRIHILIRGSSKKDGAHCRSMSDGTTDAALMFVDSRRGQIAIKHRETLLHLGILQHKNLQM